MTKRIEKKNKKSSIPEISMKNTEFQENARKLRGYRKACECSGKIKNIRKRNWALKEAEKKYNDLRRRMIQCNLRLVYFLANRFEKSGFSYEDMIQEGFLGLIEAVDRYDERRGCKFSTYAVYWIRMSMQRSVAEQNGYMRIPLHVSVEMNRFMNRKISLMVKMKREVTPEELSKEMGYSLKKIQRFMNLRNHPFELNASPYFNEDVEAIEFLPARGQVDVLEGIHKEELKQALIEILQTLEEREREVLMDRYGLDGRNPLSLRIIAEKWGVTRERIRQLENEALEKLRRPHPKRRIESFYMERDNHISTIDFYSKEEGVLSAG